MRTSKFLNWIIICSFFTLFYNCKKETPKPYVPPVPYIYQIAPELLAHYSYKPGTYWIYHDSISGRTDSIYVYKNEMNLYYIQYRSNNQFYLNDIYMREVNIDSPPLNDTINWAIILTGSTYDLHSYGGISLFESFGYPFKSSGYPDTLYPQYAINGMLFPKVYQVQSANNKYFISDSLGILKMRLGENDTSANVIFELKRWHVVK